MQVILYNIKLNYQNIRSFYKKIYETNGPEIEPQIQTQIIENLYKDDIIAGVTGAGGYDALFALTTKSKELDLLNFCKQNQLYIVTINSYNENNGFKIHLKDSDIYNSLKNISGF